MIGPLKPRRPRAAALSLAALALPTLALAACAALPFDKSALPVCDGESRRPANPHGSVLLQTDDPAPLAATPAPASAFPAGMMGAQSQACG